MLAFHSRSHMVERSWLNGVRAAKSHIKMVSSCELLTIWKSSIWTWNSLPAWTYFGKNSIKELISNGSFNKLIKFKENRSPKHQTTNSAFSAGNLPYENLDSVQRKPPNDSVSLQFSWIFQVSTWQNDSFEQFEFKDKIRFVIDRYRFKIFENRERELSPRSMIPLTQKISLKLCNKSDNKLPGWMS